MHDKSVYGAQNERPKMNYKRKCVRCYVCDKPVEQFFTVAIVPSAEFERVLIVHTECETGILETAIFIKVERVA